VTRQVDQEVEVTRETDEELTYERAVELFDEKLRALEEGELSLEAAIQAVDEASRYLRAAERRLEEAKKRIEVRPPEAPDSPPPPTHSDRPDDELPF
jgi:exodeoxyribonuclease VII small subunit